MQATSRVRLEASRFESFDRRPLTLWQGPVQPGRPRLHWAHATGFNARTYLPLLQAFGERANVCAWDMRGHGDSRDSGVAAAFLGWETYYRDLLALLDASPEPLWLAGHSIGATSSLIAACRRPEKVLGLLLCEPVLLDARTRWLLRLARAVGRADRIGLARGAARRRARFASREEALQNYRSKPAFGRWPEAWLTAYVETGFIDSEAGGVELACAPVWESLSFQHTEAQPWRWLRPLPFKVLVLAGDRQSTFPEASHRPFGRRVVGAEIRRLAGSSHFLPMENPQAVIDAFAVLLDGPDATRR